MRPFGQAVDLDLDFARLDRPGLVTDVLAHCAGDSTPAFWWSRPVGERTAALVRLVTLTEPREHISLSARCVATGCDELFEFELSWRSLPECSMDTDPVQVDLADGRAVTLRRPTGADLQRWRDARPASKADALRTMLKSLVMDGQAGPEDEHTVAAALADADPLVDFTVSCRCPACDRPNEVAVDIEALALARLRSRQRAILDDVHQLASHYGWTEVEVMAVPPARRARYIALIEANR